MDIKELRTKDILGLNESLMDLLKEHFELRMQHKSGELSNTSKILTVKKSIAQVKTIIKEKS